MECIYNGAEVIDYCPLLFGQNDTYAQLLALREILPLETIIGNGNSLARQRMPRLLK